MNYFDWLIGLNSSIHFVISIQNDECCYEGFHLMHIIIITETEMIII